MPGIYDTDVIIYKVSFEEVPDVVRVNGDRYQSKPMLFLGRLFRRAEKFEDWTFRGFSSKLLATGFGTKQRDRQIT